MQYLPHLALITPRQNAAAQNFHALIPVYRLPIPKVHWNPHSQFVRKGNDVVPRQYYRSDSDNAMRLRFDGWDQDKSGIHATRTS